MNQLASQLPSIDRLLKSQEGQSLVAEHGRIRVSDTLREIVAEAREQIQREDGASVNRDWIGEARTRLASKPSDYQRVFNLTGTVLHTNLGRALLPEVAIEAAAQAGRFPTTLEYDIHSGRRGARAAAIEQLICELTGAEAATVVNNNAAAVVLALNTLALNASAIVSRGELVEIGGSFRIPDIMRQAGVRLIEVGTTNRTHLHDYENAIMGDAALLMKVHTSNYEIKGFTHEVSLNDLSQLADGSEIPLFFDLGSGNLIPLSPMGLPEESTVKQVLEQGVDLVSFSGDKLLGGPQTGILAGRRDIIAKIKKNPLHRAFRLDKMTLAAFLATLKLYVTPEQLKDKIPTLHFLTRSTEDIEQVAQSLLPLFEKKLSDRFICRVTELDSQIGSGALPTKTIKSVGLSFEPKGDAGEQALSELAGELRSAETPIIGRIAHHQYILDCRMLRLEDIGTFEASLNSLDYS